MRSVPGSLEADRIEAVLGQPGRQRMEGLRAFPPGRDRIVLVEPADVAQLLGQPGEGRLAVEVGMHELGPS